jgi:hypothetical protein
MSKHGGPVTGAPSLKASLAGALTLVTPIGDAVYTSGAVVVMTTAGTVYALNSVNLPAAGTYVVLGRVITGGVGTAYLSGTSASSVNFATVATNGGGGASTPELQIWSIVVVTGVQTIYLNAKSTTAADNGYGAIYAQQVE